MKTIHEELKERLIEILPTDKKEALTIIELQWLMTWRLKLLSIITVRKTIKELRIKWLPILWNNRWSYISYEQDSILSHKETIDRMKEWFCIWMNKIKKGYDIALDSDKITTNN